ncbi:hypothetical protein CYMTET_41523 [Cymbomonas tetramitiformis]|uniref:Uncharacterized protein n=1 Tax=Cymbomonas tetramitiformis TaxID=36881 RepID=A0AAE0C6Z3_9CHLO|nr:hypothetical protein CYMTET_41523 [Cymbomonas tetramitiformis]
MLDPDTHFRSNPRRRLCDYDYSTQERWCISKQLSGKFLRIYAQIALEEESCAILGPEFDETRTLRDVRYAARYPEFCAKFVRRLVCVQCELNVKPFWRYLETHVVPQLPKLSSLRVFDLSMCCRRTQNSYTLLRPLCDELRRCASLRRISLHCVPIEVVNAVHSRTVTSLRLYVIDDASALDLRGLPRLTELDVRAKRGECAPARLDHLTELRALLLESDLSRRSKARGTRCVPDTLTSLTRLTLIGYADLDLSSFAGYTTLTDLRLDNCRDVSDGDACVQLRGALTGLRHFHLECWGRVNVALSLGSLPCLRNLRVLTIDMLALLDDERATALNHAKALERLSLMYVRGITHVGFVAHMPRLKHFTVKYPCGPINYAALRDATALEFLHLAVNEMPVEHDAICAHSKLQTLVLLGTRCTVAVKLMHGISGMVKLRHLTCSRTQMWHCWCCMPGATLASLHRVRLDVREDSQGEAHADDDDADSGSSDEDVGDPFHAP